MAHYNENKSKVIYNSYDEYVEKQNARFHDYDCPNCLKININNVNIALSVNPQIKSILDIGSRDSAYFDEMSKKGIKCVGIDISKKSVDYAISKGRKVFLGDAINIDTIFIDHKFDLIISCHTLEHFINPEEIMKKSFDLLNNKGIILIRLPDEGDKIRDERKLFAHTRTWSWDQVKNLLIKIGFKIVKECRDFKNEIFLIGLKDEN
jgi:2-polyprenyl-3-methyl-5-hydroxy-6-metoxy-1,4-benzoquinol methylase